MANPKREDVGAQRAPHFLKQWRLHRRLSQRALAEAAGLSHVTILRIEKGDYALNEDTLARLASALGTDVASILVRDPDDSADIWSVWTQLNATEKTQLVELAKALTRARNIKS